MVKESDFVSKLGLTRVLPQVLSETRDLLAAVAAGMGALDALVGHWPVFEAGAFGLAVAMSCVSLMLACLIPRHPREGHETVLVRRAAALPAE